METDYAKFKTELRELLKKYDAYISFTCDDCSDTCGIYDAAMEIELDYNKRNSHTVLKVNSWGIDHTDL